MINLHHIVRGAITAVHDDEPCLLIQSAGVTSAKGRMTAAYNAAVAVRAQVQTLSGDDLTVTGETERTERDRKFYLYAADPVPAGQIRTAARTGDYLYRITPGTVWKVYNVAEDFSAAGWVQLLASEQVAGGVPAGVTEAIETYTAGQTAGGSGGAGQSAGGSGSAGQTAGGSGGAGQSAEGSGSGS